MNVLSIFCLTVFCFLLIGRLSAEVPQLEADELSKEGNILKAEGEATLRVNDVFLKAEEIRYDQDARVAVAEGNVQVIQEDARMIAEQVEYDLKTDEMKVNRFRAGRPPFYLAGKGIMGDGDVWRMQSPTVYYKQPSPYSVRAEAEKANYYPGDDLVKYEQVWGRIGKLPVFYSPSYTHNTEKPPVRMKLAAGANDELGAFFQSETIYQEWYEAVEPGLLLDAYSNRGVLAGPIAEYDFDHGGAGVSRGRLMTGYINDQGDASELGQDVLGRPVDDSRYFMRWRHQARYKDRFSVKAVTNWWSDSEVLRDFRDELFDSYQEPDNYLQASYRQKHYFLSAFTRYRPNDFQRVQERLPELRFSHFPVELADTGVYSEVEAGAVRLEEKGLLGAPDRESDRLDYYQGLRYPVKIADGVRFTPKAGFRLTHYDDAIGREDGFTRLLGEVGFDLGAEAYGTWEVQNDTWEINGLRHKLEPVLKYRYVPEGDEGRNKIPLIERESFSTLLPPIDLANVRQIDEQPETHVARIGLENSLQTRHPEYGSRTLAQLDLYQDYRFSTETNQNDYSDLHARVQFEPAYWIDVEVYHRFDPEFLTARETRTRIGLKDGDKWRASVSTENLQNEIDQYELTVEYKLNEDIRLQPRWQYDARRGEFTEQSYRVVQILGRSWRIEYDLSVNNGDSRFDGLSFSVSAQLFGF